MKRLSTEEFIKRAIKIHGDKYDYSNAKYKNAKSKVSIICKKHGLFTQVADSHIGKGHGCRKCQYELPSTKRKDKRNKFITKSRKIHGDKYDYSKVKYITSGTKVIIKCKKHGYFEQTPTSHIEGKKCKKCGYEERKQGDNTKVFINKAQKVHGDKYDYSKVDYKASNKKVKIVCNKHGEFEIKPNHHLQNKGCRACGYDRMRELPKDLYTEFKKIKTAVSAVYYRGTYTKHSIVNKFLKCDWETFKNHLENNEFEFKVGQEGIDLDHIIPLSRAKTTDDLYKLSHYSNFQLLPSYYNRYEKKCKDFNINHFKEWYKKLAQNAYKNQKTL